MKLHSPSKPNILYTKKLSNKTEPNSPQGMVRHHNQQFTCKKKTKKKKKRPFP